MIAFISKMLRLFAASVVPGGGYLLAGWSPSTTLALYWIDNLVGVFAMAMRIALHDRWTGLAGHRHPQINAEVTVSSGGSTRRVRFGSFFSEFFVTSLMFTLGHGVFLAAILGFVLEQPDFEATRQGALGILACHGLSLGFDSFHLEQWPFARLKQMAMRLLGRVVLVHMTILGGMLYFAWREEPGAFFGVFVWLKGLHDVAGLLPEWNPREPPRLLVKAMSVFPKQQGEAFDAYWRRTNKQEERQASRDEERTKA